MRKGLKKGIVLILVCLMATAGAACGKKAEEKSVPKKEDTAEAAEDNKTETEEVVEKEDEPVVESKKEKEEKTESEETEQERELSKDELQKIEDDFNSIRYNGFMQCVFTEPSYITWDDVFYNCADMRYTGLTDEDIALYMKETGIQELLGDVFALKKSDMEDFIKKTSGMDPDKVKHPIDWMYLEDSDIYLSEHGDTNYMKIKAESGSRKGDLYSVFYKKENFGDEGVTYKVDFRKEDDEYVFVSNGWFDENRDKIVSDLYDEIIQKYALAVSEGWDMEKLEENGLSYLCVYAAGYGEAGTDPMDKIGYYLYDVDKDGIDELFIGENSDGDYMQSIYQMYSVSDGNRTLVIDGGERNRFYLANDDTFYNEGSGSASNSAVFHLELTGIYKFLYCIDGIIYEYDFEDESKGPYYYTKYENWNTDYAEQVTQDFYERYEKKAADSYVNIKYQPLSGVTIKKEAAAKTDTTGGGYSDDELCKMALDHYEKENGYRPSICDVDSESNGIVTLHLYDDMGDHTATSAWYEIDRKTGKGTDTIFGEEVSILP